MFTKTAYHHSDNSLLVPFMSKFGPLELGQPAGLNQFLGLPFIVQNVKQIENKIENRHSN